MGEDFALGLSGFAGVGKTEAAKYLERRYGFSRKHIAEPMRDMLAVLMRANGISEEMIDRYLTGDLKDGVPIPELGGKTSRELQISLGTEWGRAHVSERVWADTWKRATFGLGRVMNDSVRFPNEEDAIHEIGGATILIERPGFGPAKFRRGGRWLYQQTGSILGAHASERTDRLNPTYRIVNRYDIAVLRTNLDVVMEDLEIEPVASGEPV